MLCDTKSGSFSAHWILDYTSWTSSRFLLTSLKDELADKSKKKFCFSTCLTVSCILQRREWACNLMDRVWIYVNFLRQVSSDVFILSLPTCVDEGEFRLKKTGKQDLMQSGYLASVAKFMIQYTLNELRIVNTCDLQAHYRFKKITTFTLVTSHCTWSGRH